MERQNNKKMDTVSVITTFYNAEKFIIQSVSSVNQQLVNGFELEYVIVDGGCTDSLGKVSPPCRIIGNGAILCSVKGIFSAFLQTANIMADGVFQDLLWLCYIGFFQTPTLKKPQ